MERVKDMLSIMGFMALKFMAAIIALWIIKELGPEFISIMMI